MRDFIARQNSEHLRQRLSGGWRVREPAAFSRLSRSLVDMALVTGIIARLYRAVVLGRSDGPSGLYIAVTLTFGALFLLAMATIHLGRFALRDWVWRAPAFAAIEGAAEMTVSLILIWMHRESLGTGAAHFHDWPGMALGTIGWRIITISLFSLLLAGIVKWVRYMLLRKEHSAWSDGTINAGIPGERFIERRRR
ncbi:MAG: hypothetical protein ABIQ55_05410 [Gemmatimonadaceae bacterium]